MSDPQKPDDTTAGPEQTPAGAVEPQSADDVAGDPTAPPADETPAEPAPAEQTSAEQASAEQAPVAPPVPWAPPGESGPAAPPVAAPSAPGPAAAPAAAPTAAYPAQPTTAYPAQPTQPTVAYPAQPGSPAQPGGPGQPAYGAPPAASPAGQPGGPGGYPPPPGPAGGSYPPAPKKGGMGLVALVLGIVAIVTAFIPFLNYLTGFVAIAGLVVGIIALVKKRGSRGQSLTGTILSGVALILGPILAVVYTFALFGGLLAAARPGFDATTPSAAPSVEPSELPSEGPSEEPSEDPGTAPSETGPFGETITFTDNLEMTVGEPAPYTLSDTAVGGSQPENVVMDITLVNNTGAEFNSLVTATMTSAGVAGEQIVDFGSEDISLFGPTEPIPAGDTVTFRMAFNVTDSSDLRLEISPGLDYDAIVFER